MRVFNYVLPFLFLTVCQTPTDLRAIDLLTSHGYDPTILIGAINCLKDEQPIGWPEIRAYYIKERLNIEYS